MNEQAITLAAGQAWYIHQSGALPDGIYVFVYHYAPTGEVFLHRVGGQSAGKDIAGAARPPKFGLYRVQRDLLVESSGRGAVLDVAPLGQRRGTETYDRLRAGKSYQKRSPVLQAMVSPELLWMLMSDQHRPRVFEKLSVQYQLPQRELKLLFHRLLDSCLNPDLAAKTDHPRSGKTPGGEHARKQGRPRKHVKTGQGPHWPGRNVTPFERRAIEAFAMGSFNPKKSIVWNLKLFRATFRDRSPAYVSTGHVVRAEPAQQEPLSADQFRYHLNKARTRLARLFDPARLADITPAKARAYIRSARSEVSIPGQRLLIDSTVADVHLVCSWDRTRVIGRPVLYAVIDAATSAVVGIHVSLYSPSAVQAKLALFNAMMSKQRYLEKFGLAHLSPYFPQAALPCEVYADRGELLSMAGRQLAGVLGVILKIAPPYKPQWKGAVERFFKLLNQAAVHWIAGTTQGRLRERGEPDCRLDATLTLAEFTRMVLLIVLAWNHRGRPHLDPLPEQLIDKVLPGPCHFFEWGLTNIHGSPRFLGLEEAAVGLLEPIELREGIGRNGVVHASQRWAGQWMGDEVLAAQGRLDAPALMFRDPVDPALAYVRLQSERTLRPMHLALNGLDVEPEWYREDLEEYTELKLGAMSLHQASTAAFAEDIDAALLVTEEKARAATARAMRGSAVSNRQRNVNISKNRREEMDAHRTGGQPSAPVRTESEAFQQTPATSTMSAYEAGIDAI